MPWKERKIYRCPDDGCGCEVTVTKAPAEGKVGDQLPKCCCGKEMVKKN